MSAGGGGRQQLQALSQELQAIEEEIEEVEAEVEALKAEQSAIDEAIDALETLETGSTVQVPLGGGAYVRAEVADIDEVIVDLGADFAAEHDQSSAVDTLERKRDALDDRIADRREEISELEDESSEVEQQAQQLQQQMQQQQLQQMQQQQQQGDTE